MTTQRSFAYVILAIVFIGGAFIALTQMRKGKAELGSEIELAANRKQYLPDEELEGPQLNKALWASFGLLVIIAIALPMYWLAEPGRQDGAKENYAEIFTERGLTMYTTGAQCVNCHGPKGVGGAAKFVVTDENGAYVSSVSWTAPALNTLMYRFSVPEVKDILTYGRPGSPMPAWGVKGGGPNTDQQLATVIQYLWTVQLTPDEMHKEVDDAVKGLDKGLYDRMMAVRKKNEKVIDPAGKDFVRLDRKDELMLGEFLFSLNDATTGTNSFSCARCHVPGASFGKPWFPVDKIAKGRYAPNLIGIENTLTEKQHFLLVMNGSEFGKLYGSVSLGSGKMPGFGVNANNGTTDDVRKFGTAGMLSPEQVWSIVTYERNLSVERPDLTGLATANTEGKS
ncbi:MAG: c-type cytochrome [Acidimicrobiales bacterium]